MVHFLVQIVKMHIFSTDLKQCGKTVHAQTTCCKQITFGAIDKAFPLSITDWHICPDVAILHQIGPFFDTKNWDILKTKTVHYSPLQSF